MTIHKSTMKVDFYHHNAVPQALRIMLGRTNETISGDEVLVFYDAKFDTDESKTVRQWIKQHTTQARYPRCHHNQLMAIIPLGDAALMRLEMNV